MDTQSWYRWIAPVYDLCCRPLYAGPRRHACDLAAGCGPRVLDLCTGTGLNLWPLAQRLGLGGRVVGVDFTPRMLRRAGRRARRIQRARDGGASLAAVEVRQADVAELVPDQARAWLGGPLADAVLISFGLAVAPHWQAVAERAWQSLRPGGRLIVVDNRPLGPGPARLLNPLLVPLSNWLGHADLHRPTWTATAAGDDPTSQLFLGGYVFIASARKCE